MNFLIYILQSAACMAILWLAYFFLMRKETCYIFNRFYLLAIIPISIIVPLLQLPLWSATEMVVFTPAPMVESMLAPASMPAIVDIDIVATEPVLSARSFPTTMILLIIYCTGVVGLSFRLVRQLYKLYHLSIEKKSFDNNKYCNAFTFFRKIYINGLINKNGRNTITFQQFYRTENIQ